MAAKKQTAEGQVSRPKISGYSVKADKNVAHESAGAFVTKKMFEYGRFTIEDRAIADYRDGHIPVRRRIAHELNEMSSSPSGPFLKVARVTGGVIGKWHPHAPPVGPLVNMTFDRYPLIDGQGNFGTIKGDPNGADRYIECRASRLLKPHFACAEVMDTVANYSAEFQEPLVINTRLPMLLMNGACGTALGYVSSIPSHNLTEVCLALEYVARSWKTASIAGVLEHIKGPDFSFGGVLLSGKDELALLYEQGWGKLRFSCDYKIEPHDKFPNVTNIIVHGFPDPFNVKSFVNKTIPSFKNDRVIVGYSEHYNKKTQELRLVISVDNQGALKRVLTALQCTATYRFNVTERKSDDELDTEFLEHVPLVALMRKWLLWRKAEEEKMMHLALKKLAASKFLEDCKLLAMLNIKILAAAIEQDKEDASTYLLRVMKNVTQEQIDTMLGFRLKDLKRLDEGALRKKIQGIVGDIAAVDRDLQRPMAVVVRHLRQISADYGDARRTRTSGRLQDERKMQQSGTPRVFGATADGKLLGVVDEKGSNNSVVLAVPSYEGQAVFGSASVVGFFGAADVGKAGVGFESVVGVASREAPLLFAVGLNGHYNLAEQDRGSSKTIPVFLKETNLLYGAGVWPEDRVLLWREKKHKCVLVSDLRCMRKNVKGVRLPLVPERVLVVRAHQTLVDASGSLCPASAAVHALGDRNLVVLRSGRRRILDKTATCRELRNGVVAAVHDITLPKVS